MITKHAWIGYLILSIGLLLNVYVYNIFYLIISACLVGYYGFVIDNLKKQLKENKQEVKEEKNETN